MDIKLCLEEFKMNLSDGIKKTVIFVEDSAFEGVKRVAAKVASDIEKVTGDCLCHYGEK